MPSLYKLHRDWQDIFSMLYDEEIPEEVVLDTISAIEGDIEVKADNYASIIKSLEADAKALKTEEDRLSSKRKTLETKAKLLKANLQAVMVATGKTKFNTVLFNFNIQKNPASVFIKDIDKLKGNIDFWKARKWNEDELDKTKIKEVLQSGVIVDGAELVQGEGLRIR